MERPRVLIVGGGFAGVECARALEHGLEAREAELTLVSPTNYQLYLPLLPHLAAGVVTPQSIAPSLRRILRRTRLVPGGVIGVDTANNVCTVRQITGDTVNLSYDHLVLTPGSVTRTFDIPGLTEHALGMKTLAEAAYIRDHVIAQLDIAACCADPAEKAARLQFVVVGGGYAGTETAAYLQRLTSAAAERYAGRIEPDEIKWHLIDIAPRLMPELGERLGTKAMELVQKRGMEVSLGVSVESVTADTVTLTDGRVLPCHTLIWTAGVAASPLIGTLGAETVKGRLAVHADLSVPRMPGVWACGDAAAVPDITKEGGAVCPPTAQHAQRQGKHAAKNIIASLRGQLCTPYRHKDLGLVVDLGGADAVSRPLGKELVGLPAQVVARGYHLMALRTGTARFRTVANWLLNATAGDDFVRTGFQSGRDATLRDFERTDVYISPDDVRAQNGGSRRKS
ncbi:NAD(P)/FAD-dependent oxidoreductase [Streptomyces sp. NPDC053560]|uniref:NAD(P)/FAD-dependent oxidoreductase n=1 Tax=Streptomyces sp. NPDC053560 TaxID=3365711 RepID=UPI0037D27EB2